MTNTDEYLTKKRLENAWYTIYDLKQATYMDVSGRIDLRKAMDIIRKFQHDKRVPEEVFEE